MKTIIKLLLIVGFICGTVIVPTKTHAETLAAPTVTTSKNYGNGILVEWDAVEGATGYVIYRRAWNTAIGDWTPFARWNNTTELSFLDTKVYVGTKYQYGIKAYYGDDPTTTTNLGPVGPMSTPLVYSKKPGKTTSTKAANTDDGILVKWSEVKGATGYIIYRRAWSSTTNGWTTFERWNNTKELSFLDTKVYAGSRYQYGIKAYYGSDPKNMAYVGDVGPLSTNVRITSRVINSVTRNGNQFTVKWTPSKNFTGYQLQYSTDSSFSGAQTITIGNPSASSRTVTINTESDIYYFRVRSYHIFEGTTYYGAWTTAEYRESTYTLHYAIDEIPDSWNPHSELSSVFAPYVTGYTEDSLYAFDFNAARDGYTIVPSMASSMPKDVTSQYVGRYGITSDSEHQVYEISLRSNLKYDNGDPITAYDFIESARRLTDPQATNNRASELTSWNIELYNLDSYIYSGTTIIKENSTNANYNVSELEKHADGIYYTPDGFKVYVAVDWALSDWLGGEALVTYVNEYGEEYFDLSDWDKLLALMDSDTDSDHYGLAPLTDETMAYLSTTVTGNPAWGETDENLPYYFVYDYTYPDTGWEDVGYFAKDDHTLVMVLTTPLSGFNLNSALCTSMMLVHVPTYDACTTVTDGVYSNNYGTSVETYVGFGPYLLLERTDNEMYLVKNEHWHGYFESEHAGQYQTTNILYTCVSDPAAKLDMFLHGALDYYELTRDDMKDFYTSDYVDFINSTSTWYVAMNPNEEALADVEAEAEPVTTGNSVVKRILCIKEFRQALSFSIDRAAYQLTLDPTGSKGLSLYSNAYIADPENGTVYRNTEEAKKTMANYWGLADSYGPGKEYATIDDALASITGCDLAKAKELFNTAYDKAVAAGYIPANSDAWEIQIIIGQPGSGSSAYYDNGYNLLRNSWINAVKGTALEDHLVITQSEPLGSSSWSSYLKNNSVDLLFGVGWTGTELDPYGLIQAYVDTAYQYDPANDYNEIFIEVEINGVQYTGSVYAWYLSLMGETVTLEAADGSELNFMAGEGADGIIRAKILAAVEDAILQQYCMIPVGTDSAASLRSMRINYGSEEYLFGIGNGLIQYITFTMDDDAWAQFVDDHGGVLEY